MLLINCEIDLILTWSEDCVIPSAAGAAKYKITYTKLYVSVVTSSTQDNTSSESRNKGLYCYDRWTKCFRSTSKK